jgi:hypothetical protein
VSAKCKKCGAPVIYAKVDRAGRLVAVDANPSAGGHLELRRDEHEGGWYCIEHIGPNGGATSGLHERHIHTCPYATHGRRGSR